MLGALGTRPVYESPLICGRTFMPLHTPTMAPPTAAVRPFIGAEYLDSLRGPQLARRRLSDARPAPMHAGV